MHSTGEHWADMHRLARERLEAGKPVWDSKLRLADVWRNPEMTFTERRDAIVARIRASQWFKGYDEYDDLPQFTEELSEVETAEDFDITWTQIYDIADADRVWIETHS